MEKTTVLIVGETPIDQITIEKIARVCHEANAALCVAIGDQTQLPWDLAEDWQRESAIKGVIYHLDNPDATPENSHESWLREKAETGWKYGPVKNPETKEHPCFVPYSELPKAQQSKDHLFRNTVHALKPFCVDHMPPAPPEIPLTLCSSQMLLAYGYDAATKTLALQFKNRGIYHYPHFSPDDFAKIETAESKGEAAAALIKNRTNFKKVN